MTTAIPNPNGCAGVLSDCPSCPDGAAAEYRVTISGITSAFCPDCGTINGQHILEHVSDCVWQKQISPVCHSESNIILTRTSEGWFVEIRPIGPFGISTYEETDSTSCLSQETLSVVNISHPDRCADWPSSITVEPA